MTCPHPSLIQSTTYPVGTRCSQCGESAEGVLSSVRAKLIATQARLDVLEPYEKEVEETRIDLKNTEAALRLFKSAAIESEEQLVETRKKLAEAETHLRNEQHYHRTTKDELRAALDREKELQKQLELAERRPATGRSIESVISGPATVTSIKK